MFLWIQKTNLATQQHRLLQLHVIPSRGYFQQVFNLERFHDIRRILVFSTLHHAWRDYHLACDKLCQYIRLLLLKDSPCKIIIWDNLIFQYKNLFNLTFSFFVLEALNKTLRKWIWFSGASFLLGWQDSKEVFRFLYSKTVARLISRQSSQQIKSGSLFQLLLLLVRWNQELQRSFLRDLVLSWAPQKK